MSKKKDTINKREGVEKIFLKDIFMENDNSAVEYSDSLKDYLTKILETGRFEAMSGHNIYLQGAQQVIEELIQLISN